MFRRVAFTFLLGFLAFPASCTQDTGQPTPEASGGESRFVVPDDLSKVEGLGFFDHPWPSDLRRDPDGSIRIGAFPNPRESPLIKGWFTQLAGKLDGFSRMAPGYLTFSVALDPASLPADALASTAKDASLQLVDVDDKSPEFGKRHPILWNFRANIGEYYLVPNTLSWAPVLGMPLRGKTRYAVVATSTLRAQAGGTIRPNAALRDVLDGKGKLGAAWAGAIAGLEKAGVPKASVAHLSVFTTNDPVADLVTVAEDARAQPPPKLVDMKYISSSPSGPFDRYDGRYEGSPDYQEGLPPFSTTGGGFVFDPVTKKAIKQRDFSLRFRLIVPDAKKCPIPAAGYPIVLYAHGTGGDYASFDSDGTGAALAGQCLASMGIDQIFHGDRPGSPPDGPNKESIISASFFNLSNAAASRTNPRQAAVDEIARARFVSSGGLVIKADISHSKSEIRFDGKKIGFFGHSQGGLNGPLMFAVDDTTKGGVLSGAGSTISYAMLEKTSPSPSIAGLVRAFLGIPPESDELTIFHPAISLVQTLIDPADAANYYGFIATSPLPGRLPKSVLMTEGVNPDGTGDSYAPPHTIESGAIAGSFPLLNPVVWDIPELTVVRGIAPVNLPVKGNIAGGKATVGIAQFSPPKGSDGHFVVFRVARAKAMAAKFCKSLLLDEVPTIAEP